MLKGLRLKGGKGSHLKYPVDRNLFWPHIDWKLFIPHFDAELIVCLYFFYEWLFKKCKIASFYSVTANILHSALFDLWHQSTFRNLEEWMIRLKVKNMTKKNTWEISEFYRTYSETLVKRPLLSHNILQNHTSIQNSLGSSRSPYSPFAYYNIVCYVCVLCSSCMTFFPLTKYSAVKWALSTNF